LHQLSRFKRRFWVLSCRFTVLSYLFFQSAIPAFALDSDGTHPRLLFNPDDVAVMRVRCGIDAHRNDSAARLPGVRFGSQRDVYDRLRTTARAILRAHARTDDLFAPAFVHLMEGEFGRPDEFSRYVAAELLDPHRIFFELDAIVALDCCWEAIDLEQRVRIADRLATRLDLLDERVSPVNHLRFYDRLCDLATAIVLDDAQFTADRPELTTQLGAIINAGRVYIEGPLMRFCRRRGAVPTSGENGIWEEADLALAFELLRRAMGQNLWPELAHTLGRSMEHYFYADTQHPALAHGLLHDDGSHSPVRPALVNRGFVPAVPFCLASQTRDPVAVWYAARSLPVLPEPVLEVDRHLWVRLLYGPIDAPEAARRACPLGRDLGGGWVVMRSGWSGGDTLLLFDVGQPFWRSRQHFDAGQFQIHRKGRLAIDSGDDVTFEAVPAREGRTRIGQRSGDWDHYFQSTLAHNCVSIADRSHPQLLYDRPWPAQGNQRLIGRDYEPAEGDVDEKHLRHTGRLTAFETNSFYTYAAADLSPAYPADVVRSMRRHVLLINAGAVVVFDRVETTSEASLKTWHLQLPCEPNVLTASQAKAPLTDPQPALLRQVHGVHANAGIWELQPEVGWVEVTNGDGRLFARTLLPVDARRRVVGGPRTARQIPAGPRAGSTYFGSQPDGYEHWLAPGFVLNADNASYELGKPTSLGPQFGTGATWGRLDVAPADRTNDVAFLHVLIPADATSEFPPPLRFESRGQLAVLDIELPELTAHLELLMAEKIAGQISLKDAGSGETLLDTTLGNEVKPNRPIPGASSFP
jgi:hypothetical protein